MKNKKNTKIIILSIFIVALSSMVYMFYPNKPLSEHDSRVLNNGNTAKNSKNNTETLNDSKSANNSSVKKAAAGTSSDGIEVSIAGFSQSGSSVTVRAFISGIIDAGECTFSFSNGNLSFFKKTIALQNASTTNCLPLVLKSSDFPVLGKWNVVVDY